MIFHCFKKRIILSWKMIRQSNRIFFNTFSSLFQYLNTTTFYASWLLISDLTLLFNHHLPSNYHVHLITNYLCGKFSFFLVFLVIKNWFFFKQKKRNDLKTCTLCSIIFSSDQILNQKKFCSKFSIRRKTRSLSYHIYLYIWYHIYILSIPKNIVC